VELSYGRETSTGSVGDMTWRWTYDVAGATETSDGFPSQADAEAWLGDTWRDLQERGVPEVTLREDDRVVYGPMSLDPA
jgi:hypothetical protein